MIDVINEEIIQQYPLPLNTLTEGWAVVSLDEVAVDVNPGFASGKHTSDGIGIPHLRPMNVDREGKIDLSVVKYVAGSNGIELSNGDVLFNNTNSPELIGKTALISSRESGFAFSNHMTRIRLENEISPSFISRQLHFLWMSGYLKHRCTNHVNQASISSKTLANTIPILLPPTNEQTRIVEKLEELFSDLDAGVAELKAAQKKLAQYRQSLLKAAVEGELTAEWRTKNKPKETGAQLLERILKERRARWEEKQLAKFKEQSKTPPKGWRDKYPEPVQPDTSSLPELPEGWFYSELEALIPPDKTGTKTGPFGSLLKKHEHKSSGIPVVGIENIDRMKFVFGSKIHITREKAQELSEYDLLPGDVVISRSGTVGEVSVIPENLGEARFSTNIMRVRLEKQVLIPDFLCLLLNGSPLVIQQIRELCSGSSRDFLNTEILKSLVFPIPPVIEQKEIMDAINSSLLEIEVQKNAILISLKQSDAQRKNILKSAFSGQLVPQNSDDEPASALLERIREEQKKQAAQPKQRKAKVTKEISIVTRKLIDVLTEAGDWLPAQEAFRRCGIADGSTTEQIEDLYSELRRLDKGKIIVSEPVADAKGTKQYDRLRLAAKG